MGRAEKALRSRWLFGAAGVVAVTFWTGCRSPSAHVEKADRSAESTIERMMPEALGREGSFSLDRPEEDLRRRLLIDQQLPTRSPLEALDESPLPDADETPLTLSLPDALRLGARHSREYQTRKESVFRAALNLDVESEEFRTSWAGVLSGEWEDNRAADSERRGVSASFEPTISRAFSVGASVTTRLAVDVARLLTLDRDSAYGLLADASVTVPLLRGAGRRIVMEPLTQAERNVAYALYDFERFRRSYAVRTASEYLGVLERRQQIENAEDNFRRLELSTRRAERLADAGRLPAMQVDQTRQDLLRARERLISARQAYQRQLDEFKQTLGLPVDARIELDPAELPRLAGDDAVETLKAPEDEAMPEWEREPPWHDMASRDVVSLALGNRLDLRRLEGRVEDARRAIDVARDSLRGAVQLEAGAAYGGRRDVGSADRGDVRIRTDEGRYRAVLRWDPPWRRVRERARYRESLLDQERAERDYQELEDTIKQQIRDGLRGLAQARENRRIQHRAVQVAERRAESTELFLQAGRAQTRDLLEAQEALVSARNALLAARVRYRTTEWNLQRDMEVLQVTDEGLWHEIEMDHGR